MKYFIAITYIYIYIESGTNQGPYIILLERVTCFLAEDISSHKVRKSFRIKFLNN